MNELDDTLRRGLAGYADGADVSPDVERRVMSRVRASTRRPDQRRRRTAAVMGVGAAAAVAAIFGVASLGDGPDRGSAAERDTSATAPSDWVDLSGRVGEPCPGARHASTIRGLRTPVQVLAPTAGTLSDAWTCGGTPVLLYDDVQVSYERGWSDVDVKEKWADLAGDYGGRVSTIAGHPAYLHPATPDGPRSSVMLVVDGTLIRFLAEDDVPLRDVVTLAESLPAR